MRLINLTGMTFGRLVVSERADSNRRGYACWRCLCTCGAVVIVSGFHLRGGYTRSCGCLRSEVLRAPRISAANKTRRRSSIAVDR